MWKCEKCGTTIDWYNPNCPVCGAPISEITTRKCEECGAVIHLDSPYCPVCGASVSETDVKAKTTTAKVERNTTINNEKKAHLSSGLIDKTPPKPKEEVYIGDLTRKEFLITGGTIFGILLAVGLILGNVFEEREPIMGFLLYYIGIFAIIGSIILGFAMLVLLIKSEFE